MKALIILTSVIITLVAIKYVVGIVYDFADAMQSGSCVRYTRDQIIRMIKVQVSILVEMGIPIKVNLGPNNFDSKICEVYDSLIMAYKNDMQTISNNFNKEYIDNLKQSYIDNIYTINVLLYRYDIDNIRYQHDLDNLYIFGRAFKRYGFIDRDVRFMSDNGILGTSALDY